MISLFFRGAELKFMSWDAFVDQLSDFLRSCEDALLLIVVIQFSRMKKWDGIVLVTPCILDCQLILEKNGVDLFDGFVGHSQIEHFA